MISIIGNTLANDNKRRGLGEANLWDGLERLGREILVLRLQHEAEQWAEDEVPWY